MQGWSFPLDEVQTKNAYNAAQSRRRAFDQSSRFRAPVNLTLGMGVAQGQQQEKANDGYWWMGSSEAFRVGFVSGYVMAMIKVADAHTFRCIAEKSGGKLPEKYPGNDVLEACLQSPDVVPFAFGGGFRMGQWLDGVDEFYKDFRNKGLDIHLAMLYVKEQLHGKSAKELEDEVTEWRRTAAK
jgi:hypothetical protein